MGTRSVLLAPSVAALAALAACGFSGAGSGGSSSGADGAAPSLDGGGGGGDASSPPLLDGGSDSTVTPVDPGFDSSMCATVIDDAFANPPGMWAALGEASIGVGRAQLTTRDSGGQAGAIWWPNDLTFGSRLVIAVDIALDLALQNNQGDGIAVGWIPAGTTPLLGSEAQSFGLCGAGMAGVGAALDTRDDALLLMSGFTSTCLTTGGVASLTTLLAAKRFTFEITPTKLTLTTDNGGMVTRTLSNATMGRLGITAATGGSQTGHAITHVNVVSCP